MDNTNTGDNNYEDLADLKRVISTKKDILNKFQASLNSENNKSPQNLEEIKKLEFKIKTLKDDIKLLNLKIAHFEGISH